MELCLLGTGSAEGWPEPFCGCASCRTVTRLGQPRGQTCVLIDDALLLDWNPATPAAAARAGRSLTGVRYVLLTRPTPDLPEFPAPIQVAGPATGTAARTSTVAVQPGDTLTLGPYTVRVLAGSAAGLLYDVTGAAGERLLYANNTGPFDVEATTRPYDVVLLDEAGGRADADRTGHLDLTTFPLTLAALRRAGAVGPATTVLAVGLGHRNPPGQELTTVLSAWGAGVRPDGTRLAVGKEPLPAGPADPARRTLVLGGARSGKSAYAEQLLAAHPRVTYVATAAARHDDAEWRSRVAIHQSRRPAGWRTVETTDLVGCLTGSDGDPLLIDCLGGWLTARLDDRGVWDSGELSGIEQDLTELVAAWRTVPVPVVAVSNEVGSGIVPSTASGRLFRDLLGRLNARLAAESEAVLLTVAGRPIPLRGLDLSGPAR